MAPKMCEHGRNKTYCVGCGGGSICEHKKRRSRCKECEGGSICEHKKDKSICKDCKGSCICVHNRMKQNCIECEGGSICEHKKRRSRCKECGGGSICEHGKEKNTCRPCNGSSICIHNKLKQLCKECGGSMYCDHGKQKTRCKICGGSQLCQSEWCEILANPKYKGYCMLCYIHLFPDQPVAQNYKTTERTVVEHVLQQFPPELYSWVTDKRVYDGCSRRRPDLFLDLGYQVIIVEIDENQHEQYDCSCENKRLMELSQDVNHRPIVFIRFNPDDYISTNGHVTSCWTYNGIGACIVKKAKQKEWSNRLDTLCHQIVYWLDENHKTDKTVEVIHLFYDVLYSN